MLTLSHPRMRLCARYFSSTYRGVSEREYNIQITHKKGYDLLNDPLFNRGTAFGPHHRERLGLRGLLPPIVNSIEQQESRLLEQFRIGIERKAPPKDSAITEEHIRKWLFLRDLHDRNETLYYKMLVSNFAEMAPIVYTPTVGWACLNFSLVHRRPRGFFVTVADKGNFSDILYNLPTRKIDAIVVTDGSRILGLGDLGIQGMGIPIGKLDMYVAAAGFHPDRVLPVVIDVGTDNSQLLADPHYMGVRQPRLKGDSYLEVMDEFVSAVMGRWPEAVLQFEDFRSEVAYDLLHRYKDHHCVFNDDIQGTAACAVAGIYGCLRILEMSPEDMKDLKFLVCGAGSAGIGVVTQIAKAMSLRGNISFEEACKRFWVMDNTGLLTVNRGLESIPEHVRCFARTEEEYFHEGDILSVIRQVKPNALIGLTGAGRIWDDEILSTMGELNQHPIIFAMSNPTGRMECTAEDARRCTNNRAIFASGSPQPEIVLEDGSRVHSAQANNVFVFPGLALGAALGQASRVTDGMLMAAAEAVPSALTAREVSAKVCYPSLDNIRLLSAKVAVAVLRAAGEEPELLNDFRTLREMSLRNDDELLEWVKDKMYVPQYGPVVSLIPGVGE